jgi:SagB-type dehydrogenase family enzyme
VDLNRRSLALLSGALVAGCGVRGGTAVERRARAAARVLGLPEPRTDGAVSLEQALARRHSVREYTRQSLDLSQLGQLMWAAQGVTHAGNRRTAPSGGALYPLELYAVAGSRVLHYLPAGHRAEEWAVPDAWSRLVASTPSKEAVEGAAAAFVIAAVARRTAAKYGGQAPVYVFLEAGHAAQNLWLQAVALGLGAVTIGAINEAQVGRILVLPVGERAHYLIPVGFPALGA